MKKINTFFLFNLGKQLRITQELNEENSNFGTVLFPLNEARREVKALLRNAEFTVKTCRHSAENVVSAINNVVPENLTDALNKDRNEQVNWWLIRQIKDAINRFEMVLAEELNVLDTYTVLQKGAYSTTELVSNAEIMFPETLRTKLPAKAIQDIREAGKCIAFELPTAAAFHVARAIESSLVSYYSHVVGKPPSTRMRNWAVYIRGIRDSGNGNEKVLKLLEHIKDSYRNPVSHPDDMMEVDEVLVFLGVGIAAMTQIALVS